MAVEYPGRDVLLAVVGNGVNGFEDGGRVWM